MYDTYLCAWYFIMTDWSYVTILLGILYTYLRLYISLQSDVIFSKINNYVWILINSFHRSSYFFLLTATKYIIKICTFIFHVSNYELLLSLQYVRSLIWVPQIVLLYVRTKRQNTYVQ